MPEPIHVYVAGPISKDPLGGTRAAVAAAAELLEHGVMPYVPHLDVLWDLMAPRPYEDWMRLGLAWLRRCDAVLRVPGESRGADVEEAEADALGLPVFRSVESLLAWTRRRQRRAAQVRGGEWLTPERVYRDQLERALAESNHGRQMAEVRSRMEELRRG